MDNSLQIRKRPSSQNIGGPNTNENGGNDGGAPIEHSPFKRRKQNAITNAAGSSGNRLAVPAPVTISYMDSTGQLTAILNNAFTTHEDQGDALNWQGDSTQASAADLRTSTDSGAPESGVVPKNRVTVVVPKTRSLSKIRLACEGRGLSRKIRGEVWVYLARASEHQYPDRASVKYSELTKVGIAEEEADQIRKDSARAFTQEESELNPEQKTSLTRLLSAICHRHSDVGYCQGMHAVGVHLLRYLSEEDAFWVISRLCSSPEVSNMWKPGLPGLKKVFYTIDCLIKHFLPSLHAHMKKNNIDVTLFATPWMMTLFVYHFPQKASDRIWDLFLLEGFYYLYCATIAVLSINEKKLLESDFEEFLHYLRFEGDEPVDTGKLMKVSNAYRQLVKAKLPEIDSSFEENLSGQQRGGKSEQKPMLDRFLKMFVPT